MRRAVVIALLAFLAAVVGFVAYALLARSVLHGEVTGRSLKVAVERESGSAGGLIESSGRCDRRARKGTWTCSVADASGSGGVDYRIRMREGSSCWDGRLTGTYGEGGLPKRISGCVYRWQWSLMDLL